MGAFWIFLLSELDMARFYIARPPEFIRIDDCWRCWLPPAPPVWDYRDPRGCLSVTLGYAVWFFPASVAPDLLFIGFYITPLWLIRAPALVELTLLERIA